MPFFFLAKIINEKKTSQTKTLSFLVRRAGASASATVEASLILSFMLFAFVALFTPFSTMYNQMKIQVSLEKICTDIAIQSYMGKEDMIFNEAYVRLGLLNTQMKITSKLTIENNMVDIVSNYSVKVPFFPSIQQKFVQRARRRAWVGKDGLDAGLKESEEMVYVTQTGSVYHLYEDCSHIKLSIKTVDYTQLSHLRNTNGGIYHACEKCKPTEGGVVYITDDGDRYHSNSKCSGIKRSVQKISLSKVAGKNVCSRCRERKKRED